MTEKEFRDKYYPIADKQTLETLPAFMEQMLSESHDYGSICCAVAGCAIAAAWAANKHNNAGITGFQAGGVVWEFIQQWNHTSNKTGLRLVDYDDMLYPQCVDKFTAISKDTWESLQKEAAKNIQKDADNLVKYAEEMKQYVIDIAAYRAKYPDYDKNPKYYERLGMGTGAEWDAFHEKEKSGFEFAPKKPYCYTSHPNVHSHWQSIVDGQVPFGYAVSG